MIEDLSYSTCVYVQKQDLLPCWQEATNRWCHRRQKGHPHREPKTFRDACAPTFRYTTKKTTNFCNQNRTNNGRCRGNAQEMFRRTPPNWLNVRAAVGYVRTTIFELCFWCIVLSKARKQINMSEKSKWVKTDRCTMGNCFCENVWFYEQKVQKGPFKTQRFSTAPRQTPRRSLSLWHLAPLLCRSWREGYP